MSWNNKEEIGYTLPA